MKRRLYIVILFFVALGICYKVEQTAYNKKTFSYYKEQKAANEQMVSGRLLSSDKVAYLTFDDGPSEVTPIVLDTLKKYQIKATFFVVGTEMTNERESIVKRMVDEGNAIGVHTYSHKLKVIYSSSDSYVQDAMKTSERIKEITGKETCMYRFPWGSSNSCLKCIYDDIVATMKENNMTYFDWNVSAADSVGKPTKYSIMKNIKKDLKRQNRAVILMHDSNGNKLTAESLPSIIEMIRQEGFAFDTLDHMEKPYQFPDYYRK